MNHENNNIGMSIKPKTWPMIAKQDKFQKGWDSAAPYAVMPAGKFDRVNRKMVTWEEMLEGLTIFEAEKLGREEGAAYAKAVGQGFEEGV